MRVVQLNDKKGSCGPCNQVKDVSTMELEEIHRAVRFCTLNLSNGKCKLDIEKILSISFVKKVEWGNLPGDRAEALLLE